MSTWNLFDSNLKMLSFQHVLLLICCWCSFATFSDALFFHIGETEKKCFIEELPDETMVVGKYKVEIFDNSINKYVPTVHGLGIHVEVKDPEEKVVLSRLNWNHLLNCLVATILSESTFPGPTDDCKYKVQVYDYAVKDYMPPVQDIGMHVEVKGPDDNIVLSRTYAAEGRFTFTSHLAGEHLVCLHSNSSAWFSSGQLRVHLDIQVGEHAIDYAQIQTKDKLSELELRIRQLLDQVEQVTKEQNYQRYREERFRMTSESTNQRVLWWSIAQTIILIVTGFWQMRHLKSFFEAKKLV